MSVSPPAIPAPAPARVRPTIVTRMLLALAGLVLLLAAMGALSVWGVMRAEAELRRAEHSLLQLENARAIEAAFNSYLLREIDRRLQGGGDPAESREAGLVRGALLAYRRLIGAEISASDSEPERAAERAELSRASALADIFETVETRSILDRMAGRHFAAGRAARGFQDDVVQGQDLAFRAIVQEVVEDERAESLQALQALEDLRSDLAIAWTALAGLFIAAAAGFGTAFYRGLMRPIGALTAAAEGGADGAPRPVAARLPGEFQQVADRFNAMAERIGSEQRRLRDMVAARTAELQAANDRLAAIDAARRRFFANLSHELRTPVTVLLGEAQVALRAGSGEREALGRIAASGGMLRRRLDDLMRLARSEEGELTLERAPCDLGEAVRSAVEAARAYAAANEVELVFQDGATCRVHGDPEALRQAALALIDNSVKLSEPGSAVHVRLRPDGFEVADSGPGFEGCDPALLFERYVQESPGRRAGGSGLGLAIVRWIAEQHGARIRAEERPGCGAVFRMEFPPVTAAEGKRWRLLLVEDDQGIGRLLERGLGAEGYEVVWVRTLAAATDAARAGGHDLVVLDRMLPDGDGAAFCAALRRLGHDALVCMLTARDALEDKLRGFDAGADDYITKPFEFEELLARLEALRRRRAPVRPLPVPDPQTNALVLGGRRVKLTPREWRIMQHLLANPDRTIPRAELIEAGWGAGSDVTPNSIDVYVGYLRRKLARLGAETRIETVRSIGFALVR